MPVDQSLVGRVAPELRGTLTEQVDSIDFAIAEIRTAVFTLGSRSAPGATGLRSQVLEIVGEITPHLRSTPRLTFSGPVDLMIKNDFAADVIAVVREGLSNIAKHADAGSSSVDISLEDDTVIVRIDDDGRGVPERVTRASGISNLAERAARYGGSFDIAPGSPAGTVLTWLAPVRADG